MPFHKYFTSIFLYVLVMWFPCLSVASIYPIDVVINDSAPYHVHPPGQYFKIVIKISAQSDAKVMYSWRDFRGNTLTEPIKLAIGKFQTITSPSTEIGYYELVLTSKSDKHSLPNRELGEERGYGFSIQPPALISERFSSLRSKFGVVHADIRDPYLPTWAKTLTWNTTGKKWWRYEIEKRHALGILELPIISRSSWRSDDSIPISLAQLDKLKRQVKLYFSASPSVIYWETGIEENLKTQYLEQYYWQNLERKLKVIREVANKINPEIKLIYQIAGLKQKSVKNFATSRAAKWIDILSIHPYAWPNFPSPEIWHDNYVLQTKQQLKTHGLNLPIWYTEVGATHHGNFPGGFFGYPKKNASVSGLTPYQAVNYLIKLHVLAFHSGIEKVFWYNYQDRESEREYAENNFGLRDYLGYPKPAYVAYMHLHKLLADKTVGKVQKLPENIVSYEFSDHKTKVFVLWSPFPSTVSTKKTVPLSSLMTEVSTDKTIKVINAMGKAMPFFGDFLTVTSEPSFLIVRQN